MGEGEVDSRGLGQEWERDFLFFVYPFVPLNFLCVHRLYFKTIKEKVYFKKLPTALKC